MTGNGRREWETRPDGELLTEGEKRSLRLLMDSVIHDAENGQKAPCGHRLQQLGQLCEAIWKDLPNRDV